MEQKRFIVFIVLSCLVLGLSIWLSPRPQPPAKPEPVAEAAKEKPPAEASKETGKEAEKAPAEKSPPAEKPAEKEVAAPAKPLEIGPANENLPARWVALGSADANDPYRMLVTLTTKGAAIERIELNSSRYHDLEYRGGYLGHLVPENSPIDPKDRGKGCRVRIVGAGTPAAEAVPLDADANEPPGLRGSQWIKQADQWVEQPGDLITAVDGEKVFSPSSLNKILSNKKPQHKVELTVERDGKEIKFQVALRRQPLGIVRPEAEVKPDADDPLSMRLTLSQLDQRKIETPAETVDVGNEIAGLNLWTDNWELAESDQTHAKFRRQITDASGAGVLEIAKTYRLASVPAEKQDDATFPAYHLTMEIQINNISSDKHTVAYQLDGPTGLPTEGKWYANKVSRASGAAGMRDLVVHWKDTPAPSMINCPAIADNKGDKPWQDQPLDFIGIDTQFFAVAVLPVTEQMFYQVYPLRVGTVDTERKDLTDTSFRIRSNPVELAPGEKPLRHEFTIFAGPKKPGLLAREHEGLDEFVYYGILIYTVVAKPLVSILHFFYYCVGNYGLAIIMLTVAVRGCMFPMSRKQTLNAMKMQQLQPELKKLQEKYKKDLQARNKAQKELFLKHNYNPLSGCLVMFVQLPIFIGLYRALSVDVELRQAPLISESIRWCSNLAAPDMLYNWSRIWESMGLGWINQGNSMFKLGPFLNILPIFTIGLFIVQQKILMPPPTDEQSAMQQKVMKYMMVIMGVLFYKVASGLCIYFIASSLWGLAERRLLPKATPPSPSAPESRAEAKAREKADREADAKRDGKNGKSKAGKKKPFPFGFFA
jgi:YidC/Oxa1 family membrane protein insertase